MRRLIPVILLVSVVAAACGGSDATTTTTAPTTTTTVPQELETYSSEELGFRIDHPVGWTVSEEPASGLVTFTEPADAEGYTDNFNVAVGAVPEDLPAVAYYEGEVSRLREKLGDIEILEEADVSITGLPAHGITLVTNQSGFEVGISRLLLKLGDRAYEVTYFTAASRFEARAPLVQRILASFRPVP